MAPGRPLRRIGYDLAVPYTGNTIPRSTESTPAQRRYVADFWKQSPEECERRLDAMCALESQWLIDQKPESEAVNPNRRCRHCGKLGEHRANLCPDRKPRHAGDTPIR